MNADAPNPGGQIADRSRRASASACCRRDTDVAEAAEALLRRRYDFAELTEAETLVALGGDGFMLQTLHEMLEEGMQPSRCSA